MKPNLASWRTFWILSDANRDAGNIVLATIDSGKYSGLAVWPCVFLYFRSIELALKSVLVQHGLGEKEIRKLGHRLGDLMKRLEAIIPLDSIGIEKADRYYLDKHSDDYSDKNFEYREKVNRPTPGKMNDLAALTNRLCDAVQEYRVA